MAKSRRGNGNGGGRGGVDLNGAVNSLLSKFGLGGYTTIPPGRDQGGTWLPMGEPSGGTVQQNGQFWGSAPAIGLPVGGGLVTTIMIESPRQTLAQNAAPLFQRLTIAYLDGQIDLWGFDNKLSTYGNQVGSVVEYQIGVGMYMAKFNPDTNLYGVQDPLIPADVSRFDWIYLESRTVYFELADTNQAVWTPINVLAQPKFMDVTHPTFNQVLGPGEALMLACSCANIAGTPPTLAMGVPTLTLAPQIRGFLVRGS